MSAHHAPPGAIPLVYVAGPYSTGDPVQNTHAAARAATRLWNTRLVAPVVPHLSLLWHIITPLPYEDWLAIDMHMVARCHALFRLPGESSGADKEVAYALAHDLPVFTSFDALLDWAADFAAERVHGQAPTGVDL